MMKILIVSGGYLPIPAIQGGAVEGLIEMYLQENEIKYHNDIDVVSTILPSSSQNKVLEYKYSKFIFTKNKFKFKKIYYKLINKFTNKYIGNYFINKSIGKIKKSKKKYDIILCENEPQFTILLKKHFKESKIVLHLHNDFLNKDTKRYKEIIASCDMILAVSEYIKSRVNCEGKCKIAYNGINLKKFETTISSIEQNELKSKYDIAPNDFIFIFVGRTVKEKGIEELIKAFVKVNSKYKNMKLLVIGSPFFAKKNKDKFYNNLKQLANENVIFTGYIPNNMISRFYSVSDVQVTPTMFDEPFGLTALEALVSNKRVIVTNSGGLPEIVQSNQGQIINRENIEKELYDAMEKEYLNKNFYEKQKQEKTDFSFYSQEQYAQRINELIEELVVNI